MTNTRKLIDVGQRLWLDNITRELLDSGALSHYIEAFSITGLTSNPSIFDAAIGSGNMYDQGIRKLANTELSGESLFVELALEDLRRAADLFRPVFDSSQHADGWVSMEISPLLAADTKGSIKAARDIFEQADRANLLVKIPGTSEGIPAIEELIFAGVPINVTLLFSREQYLAAAEAYLRGIERRVKAFLDPRVGSVASIFISRWDTAVKHKTSEALHNRLGIAIGKQVYAAYRELYASSRWQHLATAGALPQSLLWASTGSKDPDVADTLYVEALAAPGTIDTLAERTLLAYADHGAVTELLTQNSADEALLARFALEGVDIDALAVQLQHEGAESFVKSWQRLLQRIAEKSTAHAVV